MARSDRQKALDVLLDKGLVELALGRDSEAAALWRKSLEQAGDNPRAVDYLQTVGAMPVGNADPDPFEEFALSGAGNRQAGDDSSDLETGPDGLPLVTGEPPAVPSGEFQAVEPPITNNGPLPPPGTWASGRHDTYRPDPDALFALAKNEFDRLAFEESLFHCEQALEVATERKDIQALAQRNRDYLLARYGEYIGNLDQVPAVAIDNEALDDLSYEPTSAYVIERVDGRRSVRNIIDEAQGFEEFKLYRTIHFLLENGIIGLNAP